MYGSVMSAISRSIAVCVAAIISASAAQANGVNAASTTGAPLVLPGPTATQLAFPTIFGAASAVPAPAGTGFVALSYVNPRGGVSGSDGDGDLSFGYSFGNPIDAVAATVAINILGLDPFADSGNVSVGLSRLVNVGASSATFVGLGVTDLLGWGDAADEDVVYTLTASHLRGITTAAGREIPVQVSFGYGNETTLSDDGLGTVGPGVFVGVGVGVTETLAASFSATETQVNLGLALSIPNVPGLGISLGMYDVTDNTSRQQVALGASFAF